jgi:hypothetical protein
MLLLQDTLFTKLQRGTQLHRWTISREQLKHCPECDNILLHSFAGVCWQKFLAFRPDFLVLCQAIFLSSCLTAWPTGLAIFA